MNQLNFFFNPLTYFSFNKRRAQHVGGDRDNLLTLQPEDSLTLSPSAKTARSEDYNKEALHVSLLGASPLFQAELEKFLQDPLAPKQTLEMMLNRGANPDQRTSLNSPAITASIRSNHPRAFKLLFNHPKINEDKQDFLGFSPLATAIICCHPFAIQKLLGKGANVMTQDNTGRTALDWAALMGDQKALDLMLDSPSAKEKVTGKKKAELLELTHSQQAKVKQYLAIPKGAEKDAQTIRAVKAGRLTDVMAFLSADQSPNLTELSSHTSLLSLSAKIGHLEVIAALLAAGSNPNDMIEDVYSLPLFSKAIFDKQWDVANILLKGGANPHHKITANIPANANIQGKTALHLAADADYPAIIKSLVDAGAFIDEPDKAGWSPLDESVYWGSPETIQALIDNGADIEHRSGGCTPLMRAANQARVESMKVLLNAGADKEALGDTKGTPLIYAVTRRLHQKNLQAIQILVDAGVNVNQRDKKGFTALDKAVSNDDLLAVQALLTAGAKVQIGDHSALEQLNPVGRRHHQIQQALLTAKALQAEQTA